MPAWNADFVCCPKVKQGILAGAVFFSNNTGNNAVELKRPMSVKTVDGSKTNKSAAAIVGPSR